MEKCQIITAPSTETPIYTSVFLAGGITNCANWQKEVIEELEFTNVSIFNPRQENFDITNTLASHNQIEWEFNRLEQMDIFSMYFCDSESVQPICMYELGRYVVRMQNRFPSDWQKRIVVSVEDGYKRTTDVVTQLGLITPDITVNLYTFPKTHAYYIKKCLKMLKER